MTNAARHLASHEHGARPENSLAGIAAALEEGVDGIEIDVRASADGVPMLLHDATLERTHGDAAAPRGDDAVPRRARSACRRSRRRWQRSPGARMLYIEVKERGLGRAVASAVRDAAGHLVVLGVGVRPCGRRRVPAPRCRRCQSRSTRAAASAARFGYWIALGGAVREGFAAISLDRRMVTRRSSRRRTASGCWCSRGRLMSPGRSEAVIEAGVDGVCGNYPGRISAVIEGCRTGRSGLEGDAERLRDRAHVLVAAAAEVHDDEVVGPSVGAHLQRGARWRGPTRARG